MPTLNCNTVRVGIKTKGKPRVSIGEGFSIVHNMLIGDGFHWETSVEASLPGIIEPYPSDELRSGDGLSAADETVSLINILPLESYLECVVGSEMNPEAPVEFLKAHAVISRSWALGKVLNLHNYDSLSAVEEPELLIGWDDTTGHHGFHVCSDDHCQRYQGIQKINPVALDAIRSTAGEVLSDPAGNVVDARFSKCCGGTTELFSTCWQQVDPPCLESFSDPWCDLSGLSPNKRNSLLTSILKNYDLQTEDYGFRWTAEISKSDVGDNLLRHFGRSVGEILEIVPLHRGPSGRIDLLGIQGTRGSLSLGKELWIRRLLSSSHLYSSAFDIETRGSSFILKGRGWGHGVGLCQIGAANMAVNGYDYRSILSFYYPGSHICSI